MDAQARASDRTVEGLTDRISLLERYIADLQARLRAREDVKAGNFWYWQGDGYDYPESLVCPVVMRADTLRKMLGPKPPKAESPLTMHELFLDVLAKIEERPEHEQLAIGIALYSVINLKKEDEQHG